jgi:hypothetical protein
MPLIPTFTNGGATVVLRPIAANSDRQKWTLPAANSFQLIIAAKLPLD